MSTGPVTAEGKSRSAANSRKTGWFARELAVHPDDEERYAAFRQTWIEALQPEGPLEAELFQDFLRATWRKQQVIDAQDSVTLSGADPLIFLDAAAQPNLDRLLRYEAQFERRAQRAVTELKRLQTARALQAGDESTAPPPPLADPAALAAKKRTQIALSRAAAITPELHRALSVMAADSRWLTARARAYEAGLPIEELRSTVDTTTPTASAA